MSPRIHHAYRQRGGRVAANGAGAQPAMSVIGFLARSPEEVARIACCCISRKACAKRAISRTRITIEYRWAESPYERLPALAAELGSAQVLSDQGAGDHGRRRRQSGDLEFRSSFDGGWRYG